MSWTHEKHKIREKPVGGIWAQLRYRLPMTVCTARKLGRIGYFPVCPRCQMTIEREFMEFCDRCGQKLDWKRWEISE